MTTETARQQRFTGRRVVVTGAAGGVGKTVADMFRAEGATVLGTDIVEAEGVVKCDLTDDAARDQFVADALAELGGIDVLANVAGILKMVKLEDLTAAALRRHYEINTLVPIMLAQGFSKSLIESKGNVVTVASVSSLMGQPYNAPYCSSKGGVALGMRSIAIDLAAHGVRVNCVSPGGIETNMTQDAAATMPADVNWDWINKSTSAMPGFSKPEEIAEAILFLASDAASSITGANLTVDRGTVW